MTLGVILSDSEGSVLQQHPIHSDGSNPPLNPEVTKGIAGVLPLYRSAMVMFLPPPLLSPENQRLVTTLVSV